MERLLIKNIRYLYCMDEEDTFLENADIYIEGNVIKKIGTKLDVPADGVKVIDGTGKLALPGFINTHHHFYQNITRNIPIMQKGNLLGWLLYSYGAWENMEEEDVKAAARLATAELLMTGCTTSMDFMYFFPHGKHDLMDAEFEAVKELGLRFHGFRGCMPVMEGNLPAEMKERLGIDAGSLVESYDDILDSCDRTFQKYHDDSRFSMSRVGVGPTTVVFENPEFMKELKKMADNRGGLCHTHLHPRPDEIKKCGELYNCRPHQWLEEIGWIDKNVSFAHISRHNAEELDIVARNGASVTQSPSCHMRLGYPIAPALEARDRGIPVSIGVDGGASNDSGDMLGELRTMLYVHRIDGGHPGYGPERWINAKEVFEMATVNGAKCLNRDDIGMLKEGMAADQLAQAKVDAIIWNGTAGSWLGIERDREMCQKIEEKTKIPMSTASLGLVGSYQDFDIKRLHLVTPYIKEMNDAIIREYEKLGLTAAGVTGLGITENTEIGSVTKEQLETLCCSTGAGHGEGIAVVCTNLAAAWRADLIEKRSGAVVFDSVTAAVREALKLCGLEKLSFQGWGKLLDV